MIHFMELTGKIGYRKPLAEEFVVKTERNFCLSGNSGTEKIGVSATGYDDSDFE